VPRKLNTGIALDGGEAIGTRHAVTRLLDQPRKVDRATVQARRGARLQPALRQLQFLQPRRQADGRGVTGAAGGVVLQADVDAAVQEGARRQHHGAGPEAQADLRDGADHAVALEQQVVHRLLKQPQPGLVLEPPANGGLVQDPIGLRAGGPHRGGPCCR
jgi:hypothetical protein